MMGIREKVKKGLLSSQDALEQALSWDQGSPELEGWLRRRITRGADEADQQRREAEAAKAEAAAKAAKKAGPGLVRASDNRRRNPRRRGRGGVKRVDSPANPS